MTPPAARRSVSRRNLAQLAELAGNSATANRIYAETLRMAWQVIAKNANVVDVVEADRLAAAESRIA